MGALATGVVGLVVLLGRTKDTYTGVARPAAPSVARPQSATARALAQPSALTDDDAGPEFLLVAPSCQAFGEPEPSVRRPPPVSFALLAESDHECAQTGSFRTTLARDGDEWSETQQGQAGVVCRWTVPEEGTYTLLLDGGPWIDVERSIAVRRTDAPYVLSLTPRSLFTGLVVDAKTQEPVPDFTLIVHSIVENERAWRGAAEPVTRVVHDEGGSFCISPGIANATSAAVEIRAAGYYTYRTGYFPASGIGVPLGKIEMHAFERCVMLVTVVDRATGRPLADVGVRTVAPDIGIKGLRFIDPPGSPEGITYVGGPPWAERSEYQEGRFVGGRTEENGRLRLVVPWIEEKLRVAVWSREHEPWLSEALVPARAPEVNSVLATLEPCALIDGRVWIEDERARHLRGLSVRVSSYRFDLSQEPRRESGDRPARAFLFEGLVAGTYKVEVTAKEESDVGVQAILLGTETVTLYDREALTLEFGVRVPTSVVRLTGAVELPGDASFVSVVVNARAADGGGPILGATVRRGRFSFEEIPWPRSTVSVSARDATGSVVAFWHDTVETRRSTDLGTIDLGKTCVVVQMDPANGFPLRPSLFAVVVRGFEEIARVLGDDEGRFRAYGLPAGRYRIGYGRSGAREFTMPAEGIVELRFPDRE